MSRRGRKIPEWSSRPRIPRGLENVWRAFAQLDKSRAEGKGIAPSDIESWLDLMQVTDHERRAFYFRTIMKLDDVVHERVMAARKAAARNQAQAR